MNGAFKVHLKSLYCRPKLAYAFLEHPAAMVNTLLKRWQEYMASSEYKHERDRASRDRTADSKSDEVLAKVKVYQLKHQRRVAYCTGHVLKHSKAWAAVPACAHTEEAALLRARAA